jgi:hypothetical protein
MLEAIDYRATRALQICIVFVFTLIIQKMLNFSHAGWIGFAVMMIYAGFDSGASLHRTFHRFWGAMLGLFLSYILFFFIRIDDDLIFIIVPVTVFMAYFSLSKYYVSPTIFTVALTALGSDYYQSNLYAVDQFFFDYAKATIIALSICVFFEYFVFKKNNLTHKFYFDLQKEVVSELSLLLKVVKIRPIRRSQYLKLSAALYAHTVNLNTFLKMAEHDYHLCVHFLDTLEPFNETLLSVYQNLQILFSENNSTARDSLIIETQEMLDQLTRMSHGGQFKGD